MDQNASVPLQRGIPNKPPPPYPIHRMPLAPILPTDEQIQEIVYNRIEQLYNEQMTGVEDPSNNATYIMSPSLSNSSQSSTNTSEMSPIPLPNDTTINITTPNNVYERVFLDICNEYMTEFRQQQKLTGYTCKQPLAFYNPPNRLICLQKYVAQRIFTLLGRQNGNSTGANNDERKQPQIVLMIVNNRRKRDLVDDILIQELLEDEQKWTNFDIEEMEIRNNTSDIMALMADESTENDISIPTEDKITSN